MAAGRAKRGITKRKFEGLESSPEEAWCSFWECADEVEGHYLWRGRVDAQGRALFVTTKGVDVPAADAAWAYDGRELGAGERLVASCRRKLCINPRHQAVQGAA